MTGSWLALIVTLWVVVVIQMGLVLGLNKRVQTLERSLEPSQIHLVSLQNGQLLGEGPLVGRPLPDPTSAGEPSF